MPTTVRLRDADEYSADWARGTHVLRERRLHPRNHGSVQSLDRPQLSHTILQWISCIRSPQRSQ